MPAEWSLRTNRIVISVTILDWSMDSKENNDVKTRSSIGSKHCCCSTHRPPIQWGRRSYMHQLCVISLVMLTFIQDIVLVWFLEISYHIPSMTCKVMEIYGGEHLTNTLVYEFEHITKQGGMWVIKVPFSQPRSFHGSKVEWKTADRDNRMGYKQPFILPKITATGNILNHTLIYSISLLASTVVCHQLWSQNMLTNGSPPKTANMAPQHHLFGMPEGREDNSEPSENSLGTGNNSHYGT